MFEDLRSKRNFDVLPKIITDVFFEHEFFSGIKHTISGDNLKFPYPMDYSIVFNKQIEDGVLFNSDFIKIENPYPYYLEYYNGFKDGYSNFNKLVLDSNSIFSATDTEKAFKIYCKAIEKINFKFSCGYNSKKLEEKNLMDEYYKRYKDGERIFFCYEDVYFETGKRTGIFYKAWEIILTNSTFFEAIFEKNSKTSIIQPVPEAIDLIDTNTTEKIKKNEDKNWFKVGLLFATGEINDLLKKFENNASAIARHKGNKSFRPHITESLGASKETSSQSVYYPDNFKIIYNHCKENDIKITPEFKAYYSKIELSLN